ncbi:zona pellucida sperm-binding protein 4-like [Protopterus annectens]|uniref:zona pellucida sperm-binding protein 4-like n=1 Tax=Protopterus annectens TaxID=7888 RepID=UPI001CF93CBE|nr:zona pellucida sperm-binding protein 4-like [Protopterus annectens]
MMVLFSEFLKWVLVLWVSMPTGILAHFSVSYSCFPDYVEINFRNVSGWKFSLLNQADLAIPLSSTSPGCGLTTHVKSHGWLVVLAKYDSCYIYEKVPQAVTLVFEAQSILDLRKSRKVTVECKENQYLIADSAPSPKKLRNAERTAMQVNQMCLIPSDRLVICGTIGITETECLQAGCCFNSLNPQMPCYYGNTGCTDDGFFIIVLQKEVTQPAMDLSSVTLAGSTSSQCDPIFLSPDLMIYKFPLTDCGTVKQGDLSDVTYEANLQATRNVQVGPRGTITRDSEFRMTVTCRYNRTKALDLQISVFTVAPPLPATNDGPLRLELRIATDADYRTWYSERDYPIVKVLREPVYVEVRSLGRTDPSIELVLEECWATPHVNPSDMTFWNLLVSRCPYAGDSYKTTLHEVNANSGLQFPTHHKRFEIKTFVFLDSSASPLSETVYVHCSAAICHPAEEICTRKCPQRKKRNVVSITNEKALVSSGPLVFKRSEQKSDMPASNYQLAMFTSSGTRGNSISPDKLHLELMITSALLVVASAFAVGLCILAAVSLAHNRKLVQ